MTGADTAHGRESDRMSDLSFRLMTWAFAAIDLVHPHVEARAGSFGIREGTTVVDYGCGPGRYTLPFARLAGAGGRVYAVDVQELALETVRRKALKAKFGSIIPVLACGYDCPLPDDCADLICALDMFFGVREPTRFLAELRRLVKPEGTLMIDDGHQTRRVTKDKIAASGTWHIVRETPDVLTCAPV